jgi:hypothetical protein
MNEDKRKEVPPSLKKRETIVYNTEKMIVTRWGQDWAYWRYDVSNTPDEVRLYTLKGFIDDLQDCTSGMKDNTEAERVAKRVELHKHINAGTRPLRVNATLTPEEKEYNDNLKAIKTKTFTMKELEMLVLCGVPLSAEQKDKLATFHNIKNNS